MQSGSDEFILISEDEENNNENGGSLSRSSDDEDVVVRRTPRSKVSEAFQDELISDLESDAEPIRTSSARLRRHSSIQVTPKSTSGEELSFLSQHYGHLDEDDHTEEGVRFRLENFRICKRGTEQLESLHRVAVHDNKTKPQYTFTGTLFHQDGSFQDVYDIDIWHVSIDNLAGIEEDGKPSSSSAADSVFLETVNSSGYNCFYLLGSPCTSYKEVYNNFQWLTDFLKHITDYLTWASMTKKSVSLSDFEENFIEKIRDWHDGVEDFHTWHEKCGSKIDFRSHLTFPTHTKFIYYTIESIREDQEDLLEHKIWEDLGLQAFEEDPTVSPRTLVTKSIAESFLQPFPQWGPKKLDLLETITLDPAVLHQHEQRTRYLKLRFLHDQSSNFEVHDGKKVSKVALILERASSKPRPLQQPLTALIGHAIVVRVHSKKCSRPCKCNTYRLALVLSAAVADVNVRWLELPSSTICAGRYPEKRKKEPNQSFYPIGDEVFLSDRCCCERISRSDIFAMSTITINKDHTAESDELFVHRKWVSSDSMLCKFKDSEIRLCPEHDLETSEVEEGTRIQREEQEVYVVSLFSGFGLLDQGLFDGSNGLLASSLVVELDRDAILSYKANHTHTEHCEYRNEDVNRVFRLFCLGKKAFPVICLLAAGNPCPGFSRRNNNKSSIKSQKDCTLLAHTLSWIDVFRPEMVLIENVPGMDESKPSALGQAVCCLASMGYQVKVVTIKASMYGAATNRIRLFLLATAPDIPLPRLPSPTHGNEEHQSCLVTASAITSDLQTITNNTLINPEIPYHVPIQRMAPLVERVISKIPRTPRKSDNAMANIANAVLSAPDELQFYDKLTAEQKKKDRNTLRRIHPNQPFRTVTTGINAMDARGPSVLHWVQDRVASLQEVRRFQGVPDGFIQIGSAQKQIRQIGNSVEYNLGKQCGKAFATAWKNRDVDGRRSNTGMHTFNGIVIEELSDDEETQPSKDLRISLESRPTGNTVEVDVPLAEDLRRRSRQSLSLDPYVDTGRDMSSVAASNVRYNGQIRQAMVEDDEADEDNVYTSSESFTSTSQASRSATDEQLLDSDDDDLADIETLLTPQRLRSKPLLAESPQTSREPSTPSSSKQQAKFIVRRRRRVSPDEESDEEVSPSKKLKLKGLTLSASNESALARAYGLGSSGSSWSSQRSEGASPDSAIVLDED